MNKKIFFSIVLLVSTYSLTVFDMSTDFEGENPATTEAAATTPKEIRQQTCLGIMLVLRKCTMNDLNSIEHSRNLDELATLYNRLLCFAFEDDVIIMPTKRTTSDK